MPAVNSLGMVRVLWCAGALALATRTLGAAAPQDADQAQIQALQRQVDALDRELARLKSSDPATQQRAMQDHWSMMQDHMRSMRQMPGMGARNCGDWMMMDPRTTGRGMMGRGKMNCPMMGHGASHGMGHGMGHGTSRGMGRMGMGDSAWAPPSGMAPGAYQRQMQGQMQKMRSRMAAISAETDPAKRQALMRGHYQTMYRDTQTMRGMGWMWGPAAAASWPEAGSRGAVLVSRYCGQCHAPPSPTLHTDSEWSEVTQRMRAHIGEQTESAGSGVLVPSAAEFDALSGYLRKHASAEP